MALHMTLHGYILRCDKCGRVIRECLAWLTDESVLRLTHKFKACPRCMEQRRNREAKKTSSRRRTRPRRLLRPAC